MIYFDCAATSLQKPASVHRSVCRAVRTKASPGRGAYAPAMDAANCVFDCRSLLADYFGVEDPERVIFTSSATHALNTAINSLVSEGDTVVVSGWEHNAVTRPLTARGVELRTASAPLFSDEETLRAFDELLPGADCAVCTHVSNVFGYILPIEKISLLCKKHGVPLIVDASQSAGTIPFDFSALGAEFAAMPGHKGLLGPQGTGVLLCKSTAKPLLFGGTGSASAQPDMPDFLPDRLEAGTHNVPGIAGLYCGVEYLRSLPRDAVIKHERFLMRRFARQVECIPGLTLYLADDPERQSGVLSLTSEKLGCEELTERLGRAGICVRGGLHCAPLAHRTAGTIDSGTVRFSFSPFNTACEVDRAAQIMKKILC